MNLQYLGDSFDIVKRFLCGALATLGYEVFIDPMFTDVWGAHEPAFYRFLGVKNVCEHSSAIVPSALFLDPDTGVRETSGPKHTSFDRIAAELEHYAVVFSFDQSFPRQADPKTKTMIQEKLAALTLRDCHGLYYDSHARFLFAARDAQRIQQLRQGLSEAGLPLFRLIVNERLGADQTTASEGGSPERTSRMACL